MQTEINIVKTVQKLSSNFMDSLMKGISLFGTVYFLIAVILFMYYFVDKRYAINFGIAACFSVALNLFFKHWIKRPRPYLHDSGIMQKATENGYSFASGHSLVASVSSVAVINITRKDKKVRWWVCLICSIFCILVAFSRIYLGEHFLTDVIAGLFLGAVITPFALKAVNKLVKDSYYPWLGLALAFVGVGLFAYYLNKGVMFAGDQSIKEMLIAGGAFGAGVGLFFEFKFNKFELSKLTTRKHVWWVGIFAFLEIGILLLGLLILPKIGVVLYVYSTALSFFATFIQSFIMKHIYIGLGVYGKNN